MSSLIELFKDLLIFLGAVFALLVVALVVLVRLPEHSRLKQVLISFCFRLGATLGLGALAIPIAPIPGLDAIYDVGAPIFLIYFWLTLLRRALRVSRFTALTIGPTSGNRGSGF